MSIYGNVQAFNQSAWIELFVLDATNLSAGYFYFHAGTNELKQNIVWQGIEYIALPISSDGFSKDGDSFPRPKLTLANIQGMFSSLILQYGDLLGCKVTRKRTQLQFLDAVNFADGNPTANPAEHLEDDIFYITQKVSENKLAITFELGSALDLAGVYLPRRQVIANTCPFQYRSEICGYAGGAVADVYDNPTTDLAKDACSKRLTGCKLRFGENNELSFGGFPGSDLVD